ncbi:hypothetical protein V8E55_008948 [Tylopilus felleus]
MARVPISFYLSILAGLIVLFNHFAAVETGDVALNKITGATERFCALFRDAVFTIHRSCASRLETALCGPALESVLSNDACAYSRVRYCHSPPSAQGSEDAGTLHERTSRGGYGGSECAHVYYQPRLRPCASDKGSLGGSGHHPVSQAAWDRTGDAMKTIGTLLVCTWASWWWFRAPLRMTGVLLATGAALSALGGVQGVYQVYMSLVADVLQCIQWEAQRRVLDMGVMTMQHVYGFLVRVRGRTERVT